MPTCPSLSEEYTAFISSTCTAYGENGNSKSFAPLVISPLSVAIVSASWIDSFDPGRERGAEREKEQGTAGGVENGAGAQVGRRRKKPRSSAKRWGEAPPPDCFSRVT